MTTTYRFWAFTEKFAANQIVKFRALPALLLACLFSISPAAAEINFDRLFDVCNGEKSGSRSCIAECRAIERRKQLSELTGVADKWCNYALRSTEAGNMKSEKACGLKNCIYRLTFHGKYWHGSNFKVSVRSTPSGRDYIITDPKGLSTIYSQCGTCRGIDYERGPLKGISMDITDKGLVLSVPR